MMPFHDAESFKQAHLEGLIAICVKSHDLKFTSVDQITDDDSDFTFVVMSQDEEIEVPAPQLPTVDSLHSIVKKSFIKFEKNAPNMVLTLDTDKITAERAAAYVFISECSSFSINELKGVYFTFEPSFVDSKLVGFEPRIVSISRVASAEALTLALHSAHLQISTAEESIKSIRRVATAEKTSIVSENKRLRAEISSAKDLHESYRLLYEYEKSKAAVLTKQIELAEHVLVQYGADENWEQSTGNERKTVLVTQLSCGNELAKAFLSHPIMKA